jgi:hypothetical protein
MYGHGSNDNHLSYSGLSTGCRLQAVWPRDHVAPARLRETQTQQLPSPSCCPAGNDGALLRYATVQEDSLRETPDTTALPYGAAPLRYDAGIEFRR